MEGAKRVGINGIDDKRQLTAVFGCSLKGDFYLYSLFTKVPQTSVILSLSFQQVGTLCILRTTGLPS